MEELWSTRAEADYDYWKAADPAMKDRIDRIVDGLRDGTHRARPVRLHDDLEGWFAQSILYDHYVVYTLRDEKLYIAGCRYIL
jgi:Txe/YoeB family toxin of Txe-Axe toxin-antitoxin module